MEKTKGEPKPKTEQELANEFIKGYQELCDKHGFNLVTTPAFKTRDDGTFSVVVQVSVGRIAK